MSGVLTDRVVLMSGGSRGIGLAIAKRIAGDGAKVAILAKTAEPHPKLPGTIYSAAEEIEAAGGEALPIVGDVRDDAQVEAAVAQTVESFGGIDVVVNNASAINLAPIADLEPKRYDLMLDINTRGTYLLTRAALPHLRESDHAHVLTLSPPLSADPTWLKNHGRLHGLEDGDDDADPRARRRRGGSRDRRQLPLAADDHRHRRGPEPARRRRGDGDARARRRSLPTPPTRSCAATRASAPATPSSTTRCSPRRRHRLLEATRPPRASWRSTSSSTTGDLRGLSARRRVRIRRAA